LALAAIRVWIGTTLISVVRTYLDKLQLEMNQELSLELSLQQNRVATYPAAATQNSASLMGKLIQNKQGEASHRPNDLCICKTDNITIFPMYRSNDSLSYHVSCCNYCREEWAEYWISDK
jgi:hypothetical protein